MPTAEVVAAVKSAVNRDRLVETATDLVAIPSSTGNEQACAEHLAAVLRWVGLEVTLQEVEEQRANVVGRLPGAGQGRSLMFNGHLDTSYSGAEPWLTAPGFQPHPVVRDGEILGLGIMNMKGAIACYVEAVRALIDAGVELEGDVIVAGVAGEIEKAPWGPFRAAEFRGYGAGSRHLVTHGGRADAAVIGEPTEERIVLGHWGTLWGRISTTGPFVHTAYSRDVLPDNSIVRMRRVIDDVIAWIPEWEQRASYRDEPGAVNIGAIDGGFPWRASRTPQRTDLFIDMRVPPTMPMLEAMEAFRTLVRTLESRHPSYGISGEIYVTADGSEIAEDHPLVDAIDASHIDATGGPAERGVVRWGSDAATLAKYGIEAVNYGPVSSALPGPEGESVPIDSLVRMAASYALTAARFCGVKR